MKNIKMKQESGFAMVITLAFLVIISFGFIITNNTTYSNIKNDTKNHRIKEIGVFQTALITSFYQNQWLPDGIYRNSLICERFGCIKNTINEVIINNVTCPENNCYSVTIITDYNGIEISKSEIFN